MSKQPSKQLATGVLLVMILIMSVLILWNFVSKDHTEIKETSEVTKPETLSAFKEFSKPVYLPPTTISFKEKLLEIEEVGVEPDGKMGVPSDWQKAGWYSKGAKAGEEGNVIVDGHYDTNTGAPAAFWELKDLQVGDKVTLTDQTGKKFEYLVNGSSYISITDPDRTRVFERGKAKLLTLITCGGVWDYTSGTYNKRLVITAIFDKMEKSL